MQRFLVVGCGGSGGATLQFMMDQLKANLVGNGIETWPIPGWQFVHVDVPAAGDGVKYGVPTVEQQGGTYIRTSYNGATYRDVYDGVDGQLADRQAGDLLASWVLDKRDVTIPVTQGAGQVRAVGRMLALSRIQDIHQGLKDAWERLHSPEATYSLQQVADSFSPHTRDQLANPPIVLVVSSMAGGAGASMALDVCRVLNLIPGMTPNIGLFACTAEVFYELAEHLRTGIEANALAMIGELLAAQSGAAAAEDHKLQQALGLSGNGPATPFRRIFPIGSRVGGDGATFGDGSMTGVYRGLGRGLAALMLSGVATSDLVSYRLGNQGGGSVDRQSFGWGMQYEQLVWGSFGFASLAMGRDRYAEYAAQRIARRAVDHLVLAHRQPGDDRDVTAQVQDAANSRWKDFAGQLGLPVEITGGPADWFRTAIDPADFPRLAAQAVQDTFGPLLAQDPAQPAAAWASGYAQRLPQFAGGAQLIASEHAYRWAFNWYETFTDRLVDMTVHTAAVAGLPTTRAVLDRLASTCATLSTNLRALAAQVTPTDIAAPEAQVVSQLGKAKGALAQFGPAVLQLRQHHERLMRDSIAGQSAGLLADVLGAANEGLIAPLRQTLSDQLVELERARSESARTTGLALLRTDQYAAWPTGGEVQVPKRFTQAYNEVLLTSADSFATDFEHHIVQSVPGAARSTAEAAVSFATQQVAVAVISGRLNTLAGDDQPLTRLDQAVRWRPAILDRTPGNQAGASVPKRNSVFASRFTPTDLIDGARAFVKRPHEPFHTFISESLRDYVLAEAEPQYVREEREKALVQKFDQTLQMARPLVSVEPTALQRLHGAGSTVKFEYAFSTVPFSGTSVELRLRNAMTQNTSLVGTVSDAFERALSDLEAPSIDVFGFYPNYSPLTFRSLCSTIAQTYSKLSSDDRVPFWKGRRARGLPAFLPMSQPMREAVIGGYYLGRKLGLVRWADESPSRRFEVRGPDGAWEPLRVPLLTRPRSDEDVLPTLLEGYTLAAALWASQSDDTLWPYRLLRGFFDDGVEPAPEGEPITAHALLDEFVNESTVFRLPSPAGQETTPYERRKLVTEHFELVSHSIRGLYLQPTVGGMTHFAGMNIGAAQPTRRPMMAEIAPDIAVVTGRLAAIAAQVQVRGEIQAANNGGIF